MQAILGELCLGKCTISSTRALNADAGPGLQYAENVRAALCWVALHKKGINDVCVHVFVWSWA